MYRAALVRLEIILALARNENGLPLAYTAVIIEETVCLVIGAIALGHDARCALHDHLVRALISRRVTYLVAKGGRPFGALGFAPSLQHHQHLLSHELRHLVPAPS